MSDTGAIFEIFRLRAPCDWTQQELAEFYRVQSILVRCGLPVLSDRGLTDEGEPWFVFYNEATNDVVVHIARIDRLYVVSSEASPDIVRGKNLRSIVEELLGKPVFALAHRSSGGPTLLMHPATLLPALVAASFLANWESDASRGADAGEPDSKAPAWLSWLRQEFVVLTAVAVAAAWIESGSSQPELMIESAQPLTDDAARSSAQAAPAHDAAAASGKLMELADRIDADISAAQQPQLIDGAPASPNDPSAANVALAAAVPSKAALPFDNSGELSVAASGGGSCALDNQPAAFASLGQANAFTNFDVLAAELDRSHKMSEMQQQAAAPVRSALHTQAPTEALRLVASDKTLSEFVATVLSPGELIVPVVNREMINAGFATEIAEETTVLLADNLSSENEANPGVSVSNSGASASHGFDPLDPIILAILDAFTRQTPSIELFVGGGSIILMDRDPAHASRPDYGVRTFGFDDGSAITIVGIIPQLDLVAA